MSPPIEVKTSVLFETEPGASRAPSKRLFERLTFAFARGTEESDLLALLVEQSVPPRLFSEGLGRDLFLEELFDKSFSVVAGGVRYDVYRPFHLKLLLSPPEETGDALFRQEIFRELTTSEGASGRLESVYAKLRAFRTLLVTSERMGGKFAALHRRIEILAAFRDAARELDEALSGFRSGISRASAWAHALVRSGPFATLSHLLAFEDARTVIDGRLQVGFDGTLRRFDVVGVSEASAKSFARGPLSRFFRGVWGFVRGYRFSEEDVMSRLLDQTFAEFESDVVVLLRLSLELEFYLGGVGFKRSVEKAGHSACLPSFGERRRLVGLANPWLLSSDRPVVGVDFAPAEDVSTVIVTGPNSGGKTRLLQSIAIAQLLGQQGLFVPAREAELLWAPSFFLSLVERPASDQEEGRLGMELLRIRRVFERAGPGALVVMDELCSGTNPSEGEEIFEMVLELFEQVRPQVLLSTHFLDFALRLEKKKGSALGFLMVELGERDIPTYRFVEGVAKTSMARATAARLGVTREELFELATRRADRGRE